MPKPGGWTYYGPNGIDYERSGYKFKPGDLVHLIERHDDALEAYFVTVRVGEHVARDSTLSINRDDILIVVAYALPGFKDGLPAHTCYHALVNECLVWIDDIWFKKYDADET